MKTAKQLAEGRVEGVNKMRETTDPVELEVLRKQELRMHVAEWETRTFEEKAMQIAAGLRRMAEDIEREVSSEYRDSKTAVQVAESILHKIFWGTANLGCDNLVRNAGASDKAQREIE